MAVVAVDYNPAKGMRTVLVPAWVREVTVVARTDSHDAVTVEATRRYQKEQWMVMQIEGDRSTLSSWVLLGSGTRLETEDRVRVRVLVPPSLVGQIKARAFRPDES